MNSLEFINKQFLECKIDYENYENKYYTTYFYVKIDSVWILTKKEKIKHSRFENVLNAFKTNFEYMFDDVHIEVSFLKADDLSLYYFLLTYDDMNKILNNINKIPYHKHRVQNGICLSTTNKYKTDLLSMCNTLL